MQNGQPQILRPDQASITVHPHEGPFSQQVEVKVQTPGGVQVHTFGGLTKLEWAAVQIAAGLAGKTGLIEPSAARKSVEAARQVLALAAELDEAAKQAAREDD